MDKNIIIKDYNEQMKENNEHINKVLHYNDMLMRELAEMEEEEKRWKKKEQMCMEDAEGLIGILRVDYDHKIKWQKEGINDHLKQCR